MDAALRTLREGRANECSTAPLLLFCDTLETVGGPSLLRKVSFGSLSSTNPTSTLRFSITSIQFLHCI
jgi:hypothetical protein